MKKPTELTGDQRYILELVVEWLREIPVLVIDDWGLNATGNIADLIASGEWLSPNEGGDQDG